MPDEPRAYPPGTLRIGRVQGVDVLVRSSWLVVALLIAVLLAPRIEQVQPNLGALKYVAGVAFAVLLDTTRARFHLATLGGRLRGLAAGRRRR